MSRRFLGLSLTAAFASFGAVACSHRVSPAECAALLDRFVTMKVSEDPATQNLTGAALDAARLAKVKAMQGDPDVQQVEKACEVEVSRGEYDCAIKATTSQAWNDCIR